MPSFLRSFANPNYSYKEPVRGQIHEEKATYLRAYTLDNSTGAHPPRWAVKSCSIGVLASTPYIHCDNLLNQDELGEADAKAVCNVVYMLSNGAGKRRSNSERITRHLLEWLMLYLSTGKLSVRDRMADAGIRNRTGQELSFVEIPADAGKGLGLFETLHGSTSPPAFASRLREASLAYYGTLFPTYLNHLVPNLTEMTEWTRELVKQEISCLVPANASGQVVRPTHRFALVGAAGKLASTLRLLPWPTSEAMESPGVCFEAWLADRGTLGSSESAERLRAVKRFIEANGQSRFEEVGGAPLAAKTAKRVGWRCKDADGDWEHWILPETFRYEICQNLDFRLVVGGHVESGFLQRDTEGKAAQLRSIPGHPPQRLYCLSASIFYWAG